MATHAMVPHKNKNAMAMVPYEKHAMVPYEKKNQGTRTIKDRKETSSVLQVVSEQFQDDTIERLRKLEKKFEKLRVKEKEYLKKIEHVEDKFALYAQREIEKQMDEKEKKQGSTWNKVKKMMSKDGIENKYIVD